MFLETGRWPPIVEKIFMLPGKFTMTGIPSSSATTAPEGVKKSTTAISGFILSTAFLKNGIHFYPAIPFNGAISILSQSSSVI